MYEVEKNTDEEVAEVAVAHMKTELISRISPVTLKIHSGPYS